MNKHSSFLFGLLSAMTLTSLPCYLNFCGSEIGPTTTTPIQSCSIPSNYKFEFDPIQCSLKLMGLDPSCNLEYSLDEESWNKVKDGVIELRNTENLPQPCPIVLKDVTSGQPQFLPYKGDSPCNCRPPFDAQAIYDVVADTISNSLVASACRCVDFSFVFPNGVELAAAQVSLKLHLDKLNKKQYSVDSIDEENQKVYLR